MTNDEHRLSDEELDDLLKGEHTVSGAYRSLDQVTTPKALDERILARARASVKPAPKRDIDFYYRPYAVAATVFLCFTIIFMFVNDEPVSPADELRAEKSSEVQDSPGPRVTRAVPEAPLAPEQEESVREIVSTFANLRALESDNGPASAAEEASGDEAAAQGAATLADLLDLVQEARLTSAQQAENEDQRVPPRERTFMNMNAVDPAVYRANRNLWLMQISRLRERGSLEQAATEVELFLETYPDTDIDAAIEALGQ